MESYHINEIKVTKRKDSRFIKQEENIDYNEGGVSLKDLEKYPFLMLEKQTSTREFFDNMLLENNTDITPEIELGSTDLLVEMTKIGLGITFVWKKCIEEQLKSKEVFIVNIKEKIPERYLGIVTHKQIPLSIGAKKFIELLH